MMARLRVVLVEDGTFAHGSLRDALEALDLDVVADGADWGPLTDQAEARSADAFVVVAGENPQVVSDMNPGERAAVVITDRLSDTAVEPAIERGAYAFLQYPPEGPLVHALLRAALARATERARAREEASELRDQLETRKLVERAKGILMDRLGLSEQEAFRKLQKASQDENRKMREIADSVIRAEKMFGAGVEDLHARQMETERRARPAS
jgi:AmiR/NasT family two-component response regulator